MSDLRLAGICFEREGQKVLREVDWIATKGSLHVIAGPNGAGKSTLLQIAAGLLRPTRGEVHLGSESAHALAPRERARRVAHLAQAGVHDGPFTVRELLLQQRYACQGLWPFASADDEARCNAALCENELDTLADRRPEELSGGERQRLALALALVRDPDVLLLDEPASAFDVGHQIMAFQKARALADAGKTVVVVSHDLMLPAALVDGVLLLKAGAVFAVGSAREVLRAEILQACFDAPFTDLHLLGVEHPVALPRPPSRGKPH
jgi:iron complex transport system ATP-binding protein